MSGANPLVPGAPDIDVKVDLKVQTKYFQSLYTGQMYGDAFPNAEMFLLDSKGTATMIHTFTTSGGRNTGPFDLLPGDNSRPMGSFSKLIGND